MASRATRIFVAVIVALAIGGITAVLPRVALLSGFVDDAFYYLQIARNVAGGAGFTFDGLHRTNGFHPLWLFSLIPAARILPGDLLPVRFMVLAQLLLVMLACIDMMKILAPRVGSWSAIAAAMILVVLPGSQFVFCSGMEGALLLWLLIRVWRHWLSLADETSAPATQWLILGIWCALAFLARLEAGVITLLLVVLGRAHWRRRPIVLLALVVVPIATAATYFAWNRISFHVWIPISGMIKTSSLLDATFGPHMPLAERLLSSYAPLSQLIAATGLTRVAPSAAFFVYCACLAVAAGVAIVFRRRLYRRIVAAGIVAPLWICFGLWLVGRLLLPFDALWYGVSPLLGTALLVAAVTASRPRFARLFASALIVMGIARAGLLTWRAVRVSHDPHSLGEIEAAEWARVHIRADERVGSWNAGMFGYFSHRTVVNLDGLVNDIDFYRRAYKERRLAQYVADVRIGWFADGILTPESLQRPTYGLTTDQATMPMHLAYQSCTWKNGLCGGFAIWKVR